MLYCMYTQVGDTHVQTAVDVLKAKRSAQDETFPHRNRKKQIINTTIRQHEPPRRSLLTSPPPPTAPSLTPHPFPLPRTTLKFHHCPK